MVAFSDGVDAVVARFAFGASVGFLRAWSVIHPLLGESIETQASEGQQSMGGPWVCVSLPPLLYKGPCTVDGGTLP